MGAERKLLSIEDLNERTQAAIRSRVMAGESMDLIAHDYGIGIVTLLKVLDRWPRSDNAGPSASEGSSVGIVEP